MGVNNRVHEDGLGSVNEDGLESAVEIMLAQVVGENESVAYGKGKYLEKDGWLDLLNDENIWIDNPVKDLLMIGLRPIYAAIGSAIAIAIGAITMALSIIPALLQSEDAQRNFTFGAMCTLVGAGCAVLAVLSPFARTYNLITRVYASLPSMKGAEFEPIQKIDIDKAAKLSRNYTHMAKQSLEQNIHPKNNFDDFDFNSLEVKKFLSEIQQQQPFVKTPYPKDESANETTNHKKRHNYSQITTNMFRESDGSDGELQPAEDRPRPGYPGLSELD